MSGWQGSHPRLPGSELLTRGDCWHYTLKLAARVGLAPTLCGLTNRRATLTPPGNGTAGRTSTCIVPLRRRVPYVFGHGSIRNGQRGRNCTCGPSVPGRACCCYTTRCWRSRWDLHPHSSRRQRVAFLFSYESKMVGSAGNAPVRHFQFYFATSDLQSDNWIASLKIGSGSGSRTHLKKFMRLLSVLWSSFPQ